MNENSTSFALNKKLLDSTRQDEIRFFTLHTLFSITYVFVLFNIFNSGEERSNYT